MNRSVAWIGRNARLTPNALALALALAAVGGCARRGVTETTGTPAPAGSPADAGKPTRATSSVNSNPTVAPAAADSLVAREAIAATALKGARRLVFSWKATERDARFSGQGVARVEPPYRARLDLFGPRGEGYLSAAAVDADIRVPAGVEKEAKLLPPPALLWSVLGVLNPPADARLTAVVRKGDETRLEYTRRTETWRFTLAGGRLRRAELDRGAGRQSVELSGEAALGLPKTAVYRDYAEFRELTLTLDRANEAEPFPPDTWTPGGR